jgi:hypothetical protein
MTLGAPTQFIERILMLTSTHTKLLVLLTLAFQLAGCADKGGGETPTRPGNGKSQCTSDGASIQANVFAASCNGAGCHGSESPAVGLDLVTVSLDQLKGTSSALCSGWSLIVPGSPEQSFLYQKLASDTPACGERMPLGAQLPQGDLQCVADWIRGMGAGGGCETCGGAECVALASDALHCGSCDNACPTGVACENGTCSCSPGTMACAGACVDTSGDEANCGDCGIQCSTGSECVAGQCSCPETLDSCGATCADLQSDALHCGDCGTACASGQVCLLGQCADGCGELQQCGTSCVDTQTSLLNCGACDAACPGGLSCQAGKCVCPGEATLCDTSCVDTQSDPRNCGDCGKACGAGEACVGGACQCEASVSVSFKADIAPVLDSACTSAGCHTGARPKEGLSLEVSAAYADLVGVTASQCGGKRKLVVPGSPSSSYLMQKLLNVDVCSGTQMPKAGQSLPAAQLDAISSWICAGAPNN